MGNRNGKRGGGGIRNSKNSLAVTMKSQAYRLAVVLQFIALLRGPDQLFVTKTKLMVKATEIKSVCTLYKLVE